MHSAKLIKTNILNIFDIFTCILQIYSGITRGTVLNGEIYAQRLHKLTYMYLFSFCLFVCLFVCFLFVFKCKFILVIGKKSS